MLTTRTYSRTLAAPYRQIAKIAAVAFLFLMGATALRAQGGAAYARRDSAGALSQRASFDPTAAAIWASTGGRPGRQAPSKAQRQKPKDQEQAVSEWNRTVDYSGPRFGFTYLPQEIVDSLADHHIKVGSTISQFGWQFEHEIHVNAEGPMVLNEWVFLAGGLERGAFLPSATWLVGARGKSGNEIGFGPNVSIAGVGLALAAGVTVHNGGLNVPMNIAAASSKGGLRVSFLTGFTLH